MGMITSIRAAQPITDWLPAAPGQRAATDAPSGGAAPVSGKVLTPAVQHPPQHPPSKPAVTDPRLLETRQSARTSAAQAAEDARQAYIRASIAAGISPLPLS